MTDRPAKLTPHALHRKQLVRALIAGFGMRSAESGNNCPPAGNFAANGLLE
jgi:hypothetical protein